MTEPSHEELLAREYLQLIETIDGFDSRALTIKAWSVTFSAAGLVAAYVEAQPIILLVAAASALVFWIVEGLWKISQRGHYPRVMEIEAHFSGSGPATVPFRVHTSRKANFMDWWNDIRAVRVLFFTRVALPHAAVAALGLGLYLGMPPA